MIIPSSPFTDPAMVGQYVNATPRRVPGFADLHRMALVLLAERAPEAASILVLGAGGGLELKAFAEARPNWSFVGVDPSEPMLDVAKQVLGSLGEQVHLVQGYAEDAPRGPFDGATCLLTLHFLTKPERIHVLRSLRERLKPGAPVIVAHHSSPRGVSVENWLRRSVTFAEGTAADPAQASTSAATMAQHLTLLSGDEEEACLRDAGFSDPALFYAGLSFRGWVAYAKA